MQKTRTHQGVVWPTHPKPDEKWQEANERIAKQRFQIEDELLYSCITYGDGLEKSVLPGFTCTKGLGYALLVFFARRALDIYRFPFSEDRKLSETLNRVNEVTLHQALDGLTGSRIDAITEELNALYQHGQALLQGADLEQVVLTRRLQNEMINHYQEGNYAEQMIRLKLAAEHFGFDTVQVEMDTLNSYGDDGGYGHYPVALTQTLDARDVLYCSQFIASRKNNDSMRTAAVETGEWVMINRSPTGVVDIPASAIEYNPGHVQASFSISETEHQKFFERYHPAVLRASTSQGWEHVYTGTVFQPTLRGRFASALEAFRRGHL